MKSSGLKKKGHLCHAWNAALRQRCKQCHAMNPDLVAGRGQEEITESSSDASSSKAQFGSNGNSSGDSAALVETTDEAHQCYAKLPVDHWVHSWSLPAIRARTSYALEVALTLRELCSMPNGRTKQQTKDLQAQFHHHRQAKWGSTCSTAAERRQKEVHELVHKAHEDYQFLLATGRPESGVPVVDAHIAYPLRIQTHFQKSPLRTRRTPSAGCMAEHNV
jgi:hypothetical protein